jgi:hypothetical protein
MFERYTEKSRRVIFFARYEASQFGSPYIETEHLLLGLLRENKTLANRLLSSQAIASIRGQVELHTTVREKVSTSVDLPLSHECKRVLAFGAEEAERLGHKYIGAAHLLAGLMRVEDGFAARILEERGLQLSAVREELGREPADATPTMPGVITHVPQIFNLPAEMHAEIARQAQLGGVEIQSYLLSLIDKGLHPPVGETRSSDAGASLKDTYLRLRNRMESEGLPCLDEAGLAEEIARRKGMRP